MKSSTIRTMLTLAIAATGCALIACQASYPGYAEVRANPSPELQSLSERPIDIDRHLAINADQEWRMFSEDIGRALYLDHPTRLTPFPVMSTSGIPK